jgi:hypothetical protein
MMITFDSPRSEDKDSLVASIFDFSPDRILLDPSFAGGCRLQREVDEVSPPDLMNWAGAMAEASSNVVKILIHFREELTR